LKEATTAAFGDGGFDLAFEAAGVEASLGSAVKAIEKGGLILIVGVYGKPPVVDMGVVGEHEIVLAGSMMYWRSDWEKAVQLLASSVTIEPLVSRHFSFAEWPQAYNYIDTNGASIMKVMVDL
jgi:L-iditol 2-dehydrogenase/threonine 3-dehydrogenase